jgi:hypothetical protein
VTRPTRALVIANVRRVFPEREADDVLAILDRYGEEDHHREKERVQLAILKLCDEAMRPDLEAYVGTACADYRDVLAWAESPNLFRTTSCKDPAEREKLIAQDRAQYLAWLDEQ